MKNNKKFLTESCLKILLSYSLINQEDENKMHDFLKELTYYKGLFFSVIESMKQIKNIPDNKLIKIDNSKTLQSNEQKIEKKIISNKDNKSDLYPLLNLDLNNLNKKQNRTLIKLFQECISMLIISDPILKTKKIKVEIDIEDAKEIYDILKKNFDAVLQVPGKIIYKDIFSSETQITPELFYFKWKKSDDNGKNNLLEDIKYYHNKLLKNHRFPFIFNIILFIDSYEDNNDPQKSN